jgi:chromosome segregation ATPase
LRQHEKEFHQWSLTKYEDLEKQQNGLLAKHKQQCSNEINNKKQELAHHKNQINRSLQHLQLDKEHLIKDRTDLDDEIDSKLEVFQNRKKELVSEQVEIDEKIEILKKQLKRLQKEKKEVEFSIQDQDDKMAAVRKEFESMGKKLNERCDEIKSEEQLLNSKLVGPCLKSWIASKGIAPRLLLLVKVNTWLLLYNSIFLGPIDSSMVGLLTT